MPVLSEGSLFTRDLGSPSLSGEGRIGSRPALSIQDRDLGKLRELRDEFILSPQYEALTQDDVSGHLRRGIISEFKSSSSFSNALNIAGNRIENFNNLDDYSSWFAGNLFAHLAWQEISSLLKPGQVLLSETYTTDVCRDLGNAKIKRNEHGMEMGDRVYLPDGILIEEDGRISAMYEYTLSADYFKFLNQVKGFRHAKERLNGLCADHIELVFVVPSVSQETLDNMKERINREIGNPTNFRIQSLPVSYSEFCIFANRTLTTYTPSGKGGQTLLQAISEREALGSVSLSSKTKREELSRQVGRMLEGSIEAAEYVLNHGVKHEQPFKNVRKATIITLPRSSSPSMGEPGLFQAKSST